MMFDVRRQATPGNGTPHHSAGRRASPILLGILLAGGWPALGSADTCQSMACTIVGTPGDDRLVGTGKDDVICGLGGDDILGGRGGDDLICGGPGDDRLSGGKGANVLVGGPGDDVLRSASAGDTVLDSEGRNRIVSRRGSTQVLDDSGPVVTDTCQMMTCTIMGTSGDDRLVGTGGDDVICGLGGDDILHGRGGDDLMCGGPGNDRLSGGKGANVFVGGPGDDVLRAASADDTVFDTQGRNRIVYQGAAIKVFDNSGSTARRTRLSASALDTAAKALDLGPVTSTFDLAPSTSTFDLALGTASGTLASESSTAPGAFAEPATFGARLASGPERFTTAGNVILAPDGSPFEARGVNIFPWHVTDRDVLGIAECWGFNTVRLHSWILPRMTSPWKDHLVFVERPLVFDPAQSAFRTYDIAPLIDEYTAHGLVVIVDIHDMIGKYFVDGDLTDYLIFVEDFAERYKDNPYVWLDIHNEPGRREGQTGDFQAWRTETRTILDAVRAVAPEMMLLVSGTAWGQDTGPHWGHANVDPAKSTLLANTDLIDDYDNLIRTFHMYDQWKFGQGRVENFVDQLFAADDAPVLVGEYGSWNGSDTLAASTYLHDMVRKDDYRHVGRSVWTWAASDKNDLVSSRDGSGYRVDDCIAPTNLTPLGQLVWDDNHRLD